MAYMSTKVCVVQVQNLIYECIKPPIFILLCFVAIWILINRLLHLLTHVEKKIPIHIILCSLTGWLCLCMHVLSCTSWNRCLYVINLQTPLQRQYFVDPLRNKMSLTHVFMSFFNEIYQPLRFASCIQMYNQMRTEEIWPYFQETREEWWHFHHAWVFKMQVINLLHSCIFVLFFFL